MQIQKLFVYLYKQLQQRKAVKQKNMKTLSNLNSEKIEKVLSITGFNYDMVFSSNEDGTENIIFDCTKDAEKFEKLYNE